MAKKGKVVCVAAQKGGTGKSSDCYMIAHAMHKKGKRIAILDSDDKQLTCLSWHSTRKMNANLPELEDVDTSFPEVAMLSQESSYRRTLQMVRDAYDIVLIDTKGEFTSFQHDLLEKSDHILVPMNATETDYTHAEIVSKAVEQENTQRMDDEKLGITYIISRAKPENNLHHNISNKIQSQKGFLLPYIPEATGIASLLPTGFTPYDAVGNCKLMSRVIARQKTEGDKDINISNKTMSDFVDTLDTIAELLIERVENE